MQMTDKADYILTLEAEIDEYVWEAKGYFHGAILVYKSKNYVLNFYDPVRLGQDIEDEIANESFFHQTNLIVIETVTRASMEEAVAKIIANDVVKSLVSSV
jgi:hypothetical protein